MNRGGTRGMLTGIGLFAVGLWYLTTGTGSQFLVGGALAVIGTVLLLSQLRRRR